MSPQLGKSTQEFVPLKEIRDGYALLKDGSMRGIIMTSSVNFALKSQEEQSAILFQFQDLLNSLDFSVQIFIQSRKLDIRPYLALLEARLKENVSDLLKIQTQEYMNFIKNFTDTTNIMTKSFYIVIPYSAALIKKGGGPLQIFKRQPADQIKKENDELFEQNRAQLEERISIVEQGLVRCGIRVVQLGTEELVELFYKLFNPGDTEKPIKTNQ